MPHVADVGFPRVDTAAQGEDGNSCQPWDNRCQNSTTEGETQRSQRMASRTNHRKISTFKRLDKRKETWVNFEDEEPYFHVKDGKKPGLNLWADIDLGNVAVHVHKKVLSAQSPVFKSMFEDPFRVGEVASYWQD